MISRTTGKQLDIVSCSKDLGRHGMPSPKMLKAKIVLSKEAHVDKSYLRKIKIVTAEMDSRPGVVLAKVTITMKGDERVTYRTEKILIICHFFKSSKETVCLFTASQHQASSFYPSEASGILIH